MLKEHAEKRKDAVFRGILSRVTTAGRYKPNWVWQKINPDVIAMEGKGEEGKGEEGKEHNVEIVTVVKEEEQGKSEEGKSEEEGKVPKKKVIFMKKKTLKKTPTPTPE
jgi:hypothetical protein